MNHQIFLGTRYYWGQDSDEPEKSSTWNIPVFHRGTLPCRWCGKPTPALVNGLPACADHLKAAGA